MEIWWVRTNSPMNGWERAHDTIGICPPLVANICPKPPGAWKPIHMQIFWNVLGTCVLRCQTCKWKCTNTEIHKHKPPRPENLWYIFEKHLVQWCQKLCSEVSYMQIQIHKYSKTQILYVLGSHEEASPETEKLVFQKKKHQLCYRLCSSSYCLMTVQDIYVSCRCHSQQLLVLNVKIFEIFFHLVLSRKW